MSNLERIRKELSPARRKKVAARAAQLIAEEMTLQELRHARKLTQVRLAKSLGMSQDGISKLEKRSDLLLSTLRKTVEAMGGSLSWWPNSPTAILSFIRHRRTRAGFAQARRPEARSRQRIAGHLLPQKV